MSRTYPRDYDPPGRSIGGAISFFGGLILLGVAAIVTLTILLGSWYTIDQSKRGIVLRNGALTEVVTPGLHFKVPWIDSVTKADMQTHTLAWGRGTALMEAYSADQQPANLVVSVTFRLAPDKVAEFYTRFAGDFDAAVQRLISPLINKEVKVVFGTYTAARAVTQRGPLNSDVSKALMDSIAYDPIFVIEGVQVENITFSTEYIKSVEARMQAEVEVQRLRQNLERERVQATIFVTQAQAKADAVVAEAKAAADAIKLKGEAEASAIKARSAALGDNPHLVELVQAERWDGKLPSTMVPGGALPMIGLGGR